MRRNIYTNTAMLMKKCVYNSKERVILTNYERLLDNATKDKANVLSPSSVNGYKSVLSNLSDEFKALNINDISAIDIQKEINGYSVNRSPRLSAMLTASYRLFPACFVQSLVNFYHLAAETQK